jgi:hypothetical protein
VNYFPGTFSRAHASEISAIAKFSAEEKQSIISALTIAEQEALPASSPSPHSLRKLEAIQQNSHGRWYSNQVCTAIAYSKDAAMDVIGWPAQGFPVELKLKSVLSQVDTLMRFMGEADLDEFSRLIDLAASRESDSDDNAVTETFEIRKQRLDPLSIPLVHQAIRKRKENIRATQAERRVLARSQLVKDLRKRGCHLLDESFTVDQESEPCHSSATCICHVSPVQIAQHCLMATAVHGIWSAFRAEVLLQVVDRRFRSEELLKSHGLNHTPISAAAAVTRNSNIAVTSIHALSEAYRLQADGAESKDGSCKICMPIKDVGLAVKIAEGIVYNQDVFLLYGQTPAP